MLPIAIVGFLLGAAGVSAVRLSPSKPAKLAHSVPLHDRCDLRYNALGNPLLGIQSPDGWIPAFASNDNVTEVFCSTMAVFDASKAPMLVDYGGFAVEVAPRATSNGSTTVISLLDRRKRTEVGKFNFADTNDDTVEVAPPHRLPAVSLLPFPMLHRPLVSRSTCAWSLSLATERCILLSDEPVCDGGASPRLELGLVD